MTRVLTIGAVLLIAQIVPAFAQKIPLTLRCPAQGNVGPFYFTIDLDARTVKDATGIYAAEITADLIRWHQKNQYGGWWPRTYVRQSASLTVVYDRESVTWFDCVKAPEPPV
jgi:hypothetical protein